MVHPLYRGQGIGRGLLSLILRKAENSGCKEVSCVIPDFRRYSIRFSEKNGSQKTHTKIKMQVENIDKSYLMNTPKNLVFRTIDVEREIRIWISLQTDIFANDSSYSEAKVDSIRMIVQHQNFSPDLAILGKVNNTCVGYCVGWLFNPTTTSSNIILRIHAIGLLHDYRRKGYGRTLISEVLRRGLDMGYTVSELLVRETNLPAKQLYNEFGFREKYSLLNYRIEI
jgi:ribosomal protein S18 acetylase RimI-like enzyme